MGLIMLILIGTVPAAYALNHAVTPHDIQDFIAASEQSVSIVDRHVDKSAILGSGPARGTHHLPPDQEAASRQL